MGKYKADKNPSKRLRENGSQTDEDDEHVDVGGVTRTKRAALQNGFKKRCRIAAKRLAAAVANFGCSGQRAEAV